MNNLKTVEIKAFIPSKDFETSKSFYADLGFTQASEGGSVAYFYFEQCSFLLQDFYEQKLADNLMMHLLVEDVESWYRQVNEAELVEKYGVKLSEIETKPWQMRDFVLSDPSGVLWRIGQNI
ncbi:VOC family protein [Endozoicomonas arenosclerae]|uniref:VOC family protein n=1 Tax=Endozoicomonas arenosclerae TaxID=1633495 RepID=UPI000784C55F|nr:VOC family protein [Endozoicomonas arenosclerae]